MLTPEERKVRAKIAAHAMHAKHDAKETTSKARATFKALFEEQVDPEGILTPEERARRVEHARKAYFLRLAFISARVRRQRREGACNAV